MDQWQLCTGVVGHIREAEENYLGEMGGIGQVPALHQPCHFGMAAATPSFATWICPLGRKTVD